MGIHLGNSLHTGLTRWRYDDGSVDLDESQGGATWLADVNTNITWPINGGNFRLRIGVDRSNIVRPGGFNRHGLYYTRNGSAFSPVFENTSHIVSSQSRHYEHRTHSVSTYSEEEKLWVGSFLDDDPNGCCVGGGSPVSGGTTNTISFRQSLLVGVSMEFCMTFVQEDLAVGDVIAFRPYAAGVFYQEGYDFTPQVTVGDPVRRVFVS